MQKLSAKELIELLVKASDGVVSRIAYEDWGSEFDAQIGKYSENHISGGEGRGEDWQQVFHFKDHGVYLMVSGVYYSHDGANFDNDFEDHVYQVFPHTVVTQEYKTKPQTIDELVTEQIKLKTRIEEMLKEKLA